MDLSPDSPTLHGRIGRASPDNATAHLVTAYGGREELLERLEGCLAFARRTVENADRTHPLWHVDLGQVSGYEKMMMEAGLLALLVGRTGHCEKAVAALARAIRANYDSRSALTCILRHPRLAASLGTLSLVLDSFGLATEQERAVVRAALESPYLNSSEHVPFRLLDRQWVVGLADGASEPLADALRLSAACRKTHPIYMSREDGYAITHAVMYATDFGARAAPPELDGDGAWHTIDAAVAWCAAAGDFDLLAELLLAQLLLRRRLSMYGVIAWRQCRDTWDALGFLPSPSLSATAFTSLNEEAEQRQYAFHHMYHTMLVGGLLCSALLDAEAIASADPPDRRPYEEPSSVGEAVERTVCHLQRVLGVDSSTARRVIDSVTWTADMSRVDALTRTFTIDGARADVGRLMAVDAAITLAAQDYDLPQLAAALRCAAIGEVVTPTVVAGADFLARQLFEGGAFVAAGSDALGSASAAAALANCLAKLDLHLDPKRRDLR